MADTTAAPVPWWTKVIDRPQGRAERGIVMASDNLVLGIDAGGSKTVAWVAADAPADETTPRGTGVSGPANPLVHGWDTARRHLDEAVDAALAEAGRTVEHVVGTCLGLAGSETDEVQNHLQQWAAERKLQRNFRLVNDAWLLLAAGTPDHVGIAMIAGTGSLAFGRNRQGITGRVGGWGYLLGDQGSGYAIGRKALRIAVKSADGRIERSGLEAAVFSAFNVTDAYELIAAVYRPEFSAKDIAALFPLVLSEADAGDAAAQHVLLEAARDIAEHIAVLARQLDLPTDALPVALGGGVLCSSELVQTEAIRALQERHGCTASSVTLVPEPVLGAVKLARQSLR